MKIATEANWPEGESSTAIETYTRKNAITNKPTFKNEGFIILKNLETHLVTILHRLRSSANIA